MSITFITVNNFGLTDSQFQSLSQAINQGFQAMTAQNDAINAKLADVEASNAALVTLTNAIFAELQAGANSGGLTADELTAILGRLDALKSTDDSTVAADTPPAP